MELDSAAPNESAAQTNPEERIGETNSETTAAENQNEEMVEAASDVIPQEGEGDAAGKGDNPIGDPPEDMAVTEGDKPGHTEPEKAEKLTKFPIGRIKHLMKLDPDLTMASQESVYLVTKALEMFVESLAREAYGYTERAKKKTVAKSDVDKAIDTADCLAFLEGAMDD